jgi:hypothetical protein
VDGLDGVFSEKSGAILSVSPDHPVKSIVQVLQINDGTRHIKNTDTGRDIIQGMELHLGNCLISFQHFPHHPPSVRI